MITPNIIEKISSLTRIPREELNENTELYNSTVISSLNLLELMAYVEKQYNMFIRPEELVEKNFKDIKTLSQFVCTKLGV